MPHHLLLERWLIEYAEATPMKAKDKSPEWQQAAELAKLNKLEAELRSSLRQLPLHAFLERRTSATNFVYVIGVFASSLSLSLSSLNCCLQLWHAPW